jgi:hypothetical protein
MWGVSWNLILWGMADQPGFDQAEEEVKKASPSEAKQFINQWKQRSGRST